MYKRIFSLFRFAINAVWGFCVKFDVRVYIDIKIVHVGFRKNVIVDGSFIL